MTTYAIVELEEGALHVVVGARDGATMRVLRSVRLPIADLSRETLTTTLRGIGSDVLQGAAGVHVVLGDRRAQHFASAVPALAAADVLAFVQREAVRLTGVQGAADVLLTTRLLRRLPGGKWQLGTTALARAAWEPVRAAFAASGLTVLGLHTMEACLALATGTNVESGPVAVVECNAGRARFVSCDAGSPVQVRRFLIGAGEGNPAALAMQLAMELPRTIDWLRETGHALPRAIVLGSRVTLDADAQAMLQAAELPPLRSASCAVQLAADTPAPSLGSLALLQALGTGRSLPSLLTPPRLVLPLAPKHLVALAAVAVAGFAATWSAFVDGTALLERRDALAEAREEGRALADELAARQEPELELESEPPGADGDRLAAALRSRRPTSRLLGEVSNLVPAGMNLDELKWASADRIVVTGSVGGASRQAALAALAVFGDRLRALPYLRADGQDEVTEVAGQQHRFRFRLGMAWRHS
jgi:Tfp pilus assembly protein PilN